MSELARRSVARAARHRELWLAGCLSLAVLVAYQLGSAEVRLVVDGRAQRVDTRAATVADLLIEQHVPTRPDDLVMPGPRTRLGDGMMVAVRRARKATVRADGRSTAVRSHGNAADVLAPAGVTMGPRDRLYVNGRPFPPVERRREHAAPPVVQLASLGGGGAGLMGQAGGDTDTLPADTAPAPVRDDAAAAGEWPTEEAPWQLDVYRATEVLIEDDGVTQRLAVAGPTVGEALPAAGIRLHDADGVAPARDAPIEPGMRIVIRRATPFTLEADGAARDARALADTVGEALELTGNGLRGRDFAVPSADSPLHPGAWVRVVRVREDILVEQVPIPFGTEYVADSSMNLDEHRVDRPGQPGSKTVRTRIVYENGEEVEREVVEETVDLAPVTQVTSYGTNIVWRTVDTPQGPLRYWRRLDVYATSYSAARAGTPRSAPWYGITRMGLKMRKGIVAVDPRYIPLGTRLYVDGYGVGLAGDTGGGVKRYHIDLGYDDDNYVSWHWPVEVYLLEPVPDDIPWVLP